MKVKFLGLTWNFAIPAMMLYCMVGCCIIGWPFFFASLSWPVNVVIGVVALAYISTGPELAERMIKEIE